MAHIDQLLMSDMLQLVVEIRDYSISKSRRTLRMTNLDDKLKHVGHTTLSDTTTTKWKSNDIALLDR
jgi:hypothetical protein